MSNRKYTESRNEQLQKMLKKKPTKELICSYVEAGFELVPFTITDWDSQAEKWDKKTSFPWKKEGAFKDLKKLDRFYQEWFIDNDYCLISAKLDNSPLMAVDFDGYKDGEGLKAYQEEFGDIPAGPVVETLNGGRHFYFKNALGEKLRKIGVHGSIDVLASGNVILPDGNHYIIPDTDPNEYAKILTEQSEPYEIPASLIAREISEKQSKPGAYDIDDIRKILTRMNPCNYANHADFLTITAAVQHACGDTQEVKDMLAEFWEQDGSYHGSKESTLKQIEELSAQKQGKTITCNSFFRLARAEGCLTGHLYSIKEKLEKQKEIQEKERREAVKKAIEDWYYVQKGNFFVNYHNQHIERTEKGFNAEFSKIAKVDNTAGYVFRYNLIKQAEQMVYEPGREKILEGPLDKYINLNMWVDDRVTPDSSKPHEWFLEHIDYIFGRPESEHFLDWLAYAVQNPGKKIMHAILVIGGFGTGKSIIYQALSKLFGPSNCVQPQNENLADKFTGWAKHCCFCLINELKQDGNYHFYNAIKPFITENEIQIREMRRDAYTIRNTMNILAFSNEEEPIKLEEGDRRWYVVKSTAKRRTDKYYRDFVQNAEENSGGVHAFLLNRDLQHFNPGMVPEMTEAKRFIIEQGGSDYELFLKEEMNSDDENGILSKDIVCIRDIMQSLPQDYRNDRNVTAKRTAKLLRKMGGYSLKNPIRVDGVQKKFMIIRNHEKYLDAVEGTEGLNIAQIVKAQYETDTTAHPFQ